MAERDLIVEPEETGRVSFFEVKVRPVLAEFVGSTILVFVVCSISFSNNALSVGVVYGFAMVFLIVSLGNISGGYFNPAITLGCVMSGTIPALLAVGYFFAQILGGMLGAALVRAVFPETLYRNPYFLGGCTVLRVGIGAEAGWGVLSEGFLTFIVVLTVLTTIANETHCQLAPLCIGFSVVVSSSAGAFLTGGSMNPVRSFGPAVAFSVYDDDGVVWKYHYIYWVGPLAGALVACLLFRLVFAAESRRIRIRRPS